MDRKDRLVEAVPNDYEYKSEALDPFIKYYQQLVNSDKGKFTEYLANRVAEGSNTSFRIMLYLGLLDDALSAFYKAMNSKKHHDINPLLETLADYSRYDWDKYSDEQIDTIHNFLGKTISGKTPIGLKIKNALYAYQRALTTIKNIFDQFTIIKAKNFIREIDGNYNPEINSDEQKLKDTFNEFGFTRDLTIALEHIDAKLSLSLTDMDNADVMSKIRSFNERLYENLIKNIQKILGENNEINFKKSSAVKKFFKDSNFLNEDQADFLETIKRFTENQGGSHRLSSKHEEARLSRNISIEYSLFLMKRLEAYRLEFGADKAVPEVAK